MLKYLKKRKPRNCRSLSLLLINCTFRISYTVNQGFHADGGGGRLALFIIVLVNYRRVCV